VSEEHARHPTVGRTYEIDQRAVKEFARWLPDNWLPRKQDPDFFLDYLVELTQNGEPNGLHFGVQIKGFDDTGTEPKPLSYNFKTKHLKYYLHNSQHPIFLFLVNVTTGDGYWIFAQKFLKENVVEKILDEQKTLSINFDPDDNLFNLTKFKSLLPAAERFVRDLHPGSPLAAIQKRRMELEAIDPRCSIRVNVSDGLEQVFIHPKETISFSMNVNSKNVEGWKAFVEKGEMIRTTPGEVAFVGMPLFQDALNQSDVIELQIAGQQPASITIVKPNNEFPIITHIDGTFISGTKFSRFVGNLPNSPLALSFELPHAYLDTRRSVDLSIAFSLSKWAGQPILNLSAFNQIKTFSESFSGEQKPKIEIFVGETSRVRGELGGNGTPIFAFIENSLAWLIKCRWLAEHFNVNPLLPSLDTFSQADYNRLEELHDVLNLGRMAWPRPYLELSVEVEPIPGSNLAPADTAKSLRLQSLRHTYNFFGTPVSLPPMENTFSEVNLFSRTPVDGSKMEKLIFKGNEKTIQISSLVT